MYSETFFITTTRDNYTKAYEYLILIVLLMFMHICSQDSTTQPFLGLIGLNWSVNFTVPIVQINYLLECMDKNVLLLRRESMMSPLHRGNSSSGLSSEMTAILSRAEL